MKLELLLVLGVIASTSLSAPVAMADTFSSERRTTTTEQSLPMTETLETRTSTLESGPSSTTVIREQPVIINQPAREEVVVIKQHHHHHLIKVGPVKVF